MLQGNSILFISLTFSLDAQAYPSLIPGNAKNLVAARIIPTFL